MADGEDAVTPRQAVENREHGREGVSRRTAAAAAVEPEEDSADVFDSGLSLLFDVPPFALSPEQDGLCTYHPPVRLTSASHAQDAGERDPKPLKLRLAQPPAALYTTLQVNHLWLSGIYLADLISLGELDLRGRRVAELGAGAGLPSIVACKNGAIVTTSDWGVEEVLAALKDNFEAACPGKKDKTWAVRGHKWGEDPTTLLEALTTSDAPSRRYDAMLLADVLWTTGAHAVLLDSVFALLSPQGSAHIAAGLHTGRGPLERFIAAAEARGARIRPVREVRWKIGGGWDEHRSDGPAGLEEERGIVVYFTLQLPPQQ